MSKWKSYGKELGQEFKNDDATTLAAAQAYYYLLSIVPMLILLLTILPYLNIDPQQAVRTMESVLPQQTASAFQDNIVNVVSQPRGGLLTLGIIGTIWSASNAVNAFINASNHAYDVEETRSFIKVRLLSIVLTIGMILALVVALALPIFGGVIISAIESTLNLSGQLSILLSVLRWVVSVIIMAAILSVLYHFAPNKKFPFKEVIVGALIATVLWQLISWAFSFYLANFGNYSATYGSLGGVIILMLWFFLTGLVLVVGAEINAIYHRRKHGLTKGNKNKKNTNDEEW